LSQYIGEVAALATSVLFSATSIQFTLAGRQVGSIVVNRMRLVLAVLILAAIILITQHSLPAFDSAERWFWLGLSGIVGLAIGDTFLFQAFVMIGPRLSMLMMSLAPIIGAMTAWLILGENLSALQTVGILLTVSGIAWVVMESNGNKKGEISDHSFLRGITFGIAAATCQALGLIFAKIGLTGEYPVISGTLIRMLAAMITIWGFTIIQRQAKTTIMQVARTRRAFWNILGGTITGPVLGVTASLIAVQFSPVGVASTLMTLSPILLLPVGHFAFNERFGWQVVLGTFIAISGVILLLLV
jgi:drug/metabolite transporter (DMT)-like permease